MCCTVDLNKTRPGQTEVWKVLSKGRKDGYYSPFQDNLWEIGQEQVSNRQSVELHVLEVASHEVDCGIHVILSRESAEIILQKFRNEMWGTFVLAKLRVDPEDWACTGSWVTDDNAVYMKATLVAVEEVSSA